MLNKSISRRRKKRRHVNKASDGKLNVIGSNIRRLRRNARPKITQDNLVGRLAAQNILLDRSAITKIEAGRRFLKDFEIIALAKALRVPIYSLFGEEK